MRGARRRSRQGGGVAMSAAAAAAAPRRHDICHMMTTTKPKQPMRQTVAIAFVVQGHDYARRTCHMPHREKERQYKERKVERRSLPS